MNSIDIEIDITRECNFQCPSCMRFANLYNKNSKSVMTLDEIKNIFLEIQNLNLEIQQLTIVGGEPTLHPQFKEICIFLKTLSFIKNYKLPTNHSNFKLEFWAKHYLNIDINLQKNNFIRNNFLKQKIQKYKKHINGYNPTKIKILNIDEIHKNCTILKHCGYIIYKFNNKIKYANCSWSVFISRLLDKEDNYSFNTLQDLLNFNKNNLKNICCYCWYAYQQLNDISIKNSFNKYGIIDDFKYGYNKLILNKSDYN